ncbi:hypothetical protein LCGC14_3011970 [marine sediment metagenome]|uniref:Uncharacterized protein n=1 Tax=marine sediment metagenome TaxID=412755 RepID=A0A0F8XKP9_9ZZZZ
MSEDRLEEIKRTTGSLNLPYMIMGQWEWLISEVERLRGENIEQDTEIQQYESDVIAYEKTIATIREALKPFVRDYPTEVRKSGPLPPGYTSDEFDAHCVFCDQGDRRTFTIRPHSKDCPIYGAKKALATAQEDKS